MALCRLTTAFLVAASFEVYGARVTRRQKSVSAPEAVETDAKVIAGVPVLNYDKAYASVYGASPAADSREHWVVVMEPGTSDAQLEQMCKISKGCERMGHPSKGGVPYFVVNGTESDLEKVLSTNASQAQFVEPDLLAFLIPEIDEAKTSATESWGLQRVGAPRRAGEGNGVHVYVLDTGVRTSHEDFGSRAVPTLDMTSNRLVECDGNTACAADRQGHGTHCAGTVAGRVFGVAPKATVHGVKVLGDGGEGYLTWSYDALDWLSTTGLRPAVASMSLGSSGNQYAMRVAVDTAVEAGITVVVAGGNDNSDACGYSPAFVPSAITVGSTTPTDAVSYFSNYGSCTDVWAPGSSIVSASHSTDQGSAEMSGTSMACPHVSGAAALVLEANPQMRSADVLKSMLDNAELEAISGLRRGDVNKLLWVGSGPAPMPAPTPPPSCPDFAQQSEPDGDGKCSCSYSTHCSSSDRDQNCLWGRHFRYDCPDCKCVEEECPGFAASPYPDSDGDCYCPRGRPCWKNGQEGTCNPYGVGLEEFFHFTCPDCKCSFAAMSASPYFLFQMFLVVLGINACAQMPMH